MILSEIIEKVLRKFSVKVGFSVQIEIPHDKYRNKEVLVVARLDDWHKRISEILYIWADLQKDHRFCDWVLRIVGDVNDLAEKIISVLSNPSKCKQMGKESYLIIRDKINLETVSQRYIDAFNYVMQQ